MKKIITSIIILLMIICISQISYATESISLDLTMSTDISPSTKTIELTINLGEFTDIPENPIMGYESILEYNPNIFSSVEVEGQNGWTAQFTESTGRLMGETNTTGVANTSIAKIILTLKEDAPSGETKINLKDILLTVQTNDKELDFNYEKEVKILIPEKDEEPDLNTIGNTNTGTNQSMENQTGLNTSNGTNTNTNINTNLNTNTNTNSNSSIKLQSTKGNNSDKTTTGKSLPKTGTGKIIIAITLISIIGIGCLVKYKTIEIK